MRCFHSVAALSLLLTVSSAAAADPDGDSEAARELHALFDESWERTLREFPTFASELGVAEGNSRWRDLSSESLREFHQYQESLLGRIDAIDPQDLSPADRINRRLFRREIASDVEGWQFRWHLVPLTQREGIQDAGSLADSLRFETARDYEDWLARMDAFPRSMDQTLALMREGVRSGIVHARVVMTRVPNQIEKQIVDDPAESLFYKPFRRFPESIPTAERQRLEARARSAIADKIVPAYREMLTFFTEEYLPACYDRVGVWQIPRGREFYAHRARHFTTTDLTPQAIHEIGLNEVRRIRGVMEAIVREVGWKGTFAEFRDEQRTNPKY
jgi:prolyl oligopeptidase